jgi:hypothetical protein
MTTFTFVNKHKMSDSESDYSEGDEVSRDPQAIEARKVKRYIGKVLSEVLDAFVTAKLSTKGLRMRL